MIDGKTIELRNASYNRIGTIDVEMNHPDFGWIAFTCDPDDTMEYSADIHDRALAMNPAAYVAPPPTVPQVVSPYQARVALLNAGLLDQLTTLMADPSTPQAAKIAWEYATEWDRSSDFILSLGPSLGLSEADIDNLFIAASKVI